MTGAGRGAQLGRRLARLPNVRLLAGSPSTRPGAIRLGMGGTPMGGGSTRSEASTSCLCNHR